MIEQSLVKFFQTYKKEISISELIKILKINFNEIDALLQALYELEKKGIIFQDNGLYMHVPKDFYLKHGTILLSNKKNYYIEADGTKIIIPNNKLNKARKGDIVFVSIDEKYDRYKKLIGSVIRIVDKPTYDCNSYICKTKINKDYKNSSYYVMVGNKKYMVPSNKLNGAYPGDTVNIQIYKIEDKRYGCVVNVLERLQSQHVFEYRNINGVLTWVPIGTSMFETKLLNNLESFDIGDRIVANINENNELEFVGKLENNDTLISQIKAIICDFGVEHEFNQNVMEEACKLKCSEISFDRKDLRNLLTVTIDPETAKDLDDSISLEKLDNGFRLYGHIADVSCYVKMGSSIYEEAKRRTTSGYFANVVIPMLPYQLSNDLCSLTPGEDKLAKTFQIDIDFDGNIKDFKIYRSIIRNDFKMTYDKVNTVLSGTIIDEYMPYLEMLRAMKDLCNILEMRRLDRGFIKFVDDEYEFTINGENVAIASHDRGIAELIVENFMLLINEMTAEYLYYLDVPVMYRNHSVPDCTKLESLRYDLQKHNYYVKTLKNADDSKMFQRVVLSLCSNKNADEIKFLSKILLKYMMRAFYSTKNFGHYGLALERYATFTSPIRKLSDLQNHMILDKVLNCDFDFQDIDKEMAISCEHINEQCLKIELLEKEVNYFLLKYYIENSMDNDIKVRITFINKDGIHVRTEDNICGLIPINVSYDYQKNMCYYGDNCYKVNDEVFVNLVAIKDNEIIFEISNNIEKRKKYEY